MVATTSGSEPTPGVNRRGFLAGALALTVGVPLLDACAPAASPAGGGGAASSSPAPAGSTPSAAKNNVFPTYIPVANGPKPDFHDDNPLFSDAFDNFPQNPIKANQSAPGAGGVVNALVTAYFPLP